MTNLEQICAWLKAHDNYLILSHQNPDGDTLGSANALCRALRLLGKRAQTACSDPIPASYNFLLEPSDPEGFEPEAIIAVDIADVKLLGPKLRPYGERIDLCIDHHQSNCVQAPRILLDAKAAATAELVYDLIPALGVQLDLQMAICLYTALSTDTGCFRYSNATARSHRIAADLLDFGFDHAEIDRQMLETKSQRRIQIERMVLDTLEYHFENQCAIAVITSEMMALSGAEESELDGVSTIPRQIEGIEVGATLRQKAECEFRVSLRTNRWADASKICGRLGGGGHARAAGCSLKGTLAEAKERLLAAIAQELNQQ